MKITTTTHIDNLIPLTNPCEYPTGNAGHDAVRIKHYNIAMANGFDILNAVKVFQNHPVIKQLETDRQIYVELIGCQLLVLTTEQAKHKVKTVVERCFTYHSPTFKQSFHTYDYDVNEVITLRLKHLPIASKNLLKQIAKKYNRAFQIGLDVYPQSVMNKTTANQYQKTLTRAEKRNKYN